MIVKSTRCEIIKPTLCDWGTLGKVLREVQYETYRALNTVITRCWERNKDRLRYKEQHGVYPDEKLDLYKELNGEFTRMATGNLSQTVRLGEAKWKNDLKEVMRGERSIPNFKRDTAILVASQNVCEFRRSGNDYVAKIRIISSKFKEELGLDSCSLDFVLAAKGSPKIILKRIISGEYKCGGARIVNKGRKWFLDITYKFEAKQYPLNPERVMGVDMGVVNAAYMAVSDDSYWREPIEGKELMAFRNRVESRRRDLLKQGRYCGDGRIGHGRQARIQNIDKLSDKISNFRDSTNHRYARFIVNTAFKMQCSVIQLEDLSGISASDAFLKKWTYYDLQQKIEQKAAEYGIKVKKIDPKYTSQRCSECGHICEENRKEQAKFICQCCGYKANADFNAARNIANPNIEEIIKVTLKRTIIA